MLASAGSVAADPSRVHRAELGGRVAWKAEVVADRTYVDRPMVYVAGPYTNPDPVQNTHDTVLEAGRIIEEGRVTPLVPHLTLLWHLVEPRSLEFWYAYDLATLARCDAVLRLEGASTGADREVEFAREIGKPVFTSKAELYAWVDEVAAS